METVRCIKRKFGKLRRQPSLESIQHFISSCAQSTCRKAPAMLGLEDYQHLESILHCCFSLYPYISLHAGHGYQQYRT